MNLVHGQYHRSLSHFVRNPYQQERAAVGYEMPELMKLEKRRKEKLKIHCGNLLEEDE